MSVTAKDIAKALNITPAAVSMALNNKPGVSDETRSKVFEMANQMGFKYSKKMLRHNHKMIAFIFFHKNFIFETPFFSELGQAVEQTLKSFGYHMNAYHIHENDDIAEQLKLILNDDPEGLILLGTLISANEIHYFKNCPKPLVLLDASFYDFDGSTVVINNVDGARQATEYLIERCKCCPGYIRYGNPFMNLIERSDGFYNALRSHGYHPSKVIIHNVIPSIEGAYQDMLDIIDSGEPLASAYFCDNDELALGAMRAFLEKGFKIPEDVSIIGFDNMYYSQLMDPPLTSVSVPKRFMGQVAARLVVEQATNSEFVNYPTKIEINTKLVIRKSVK